MDDDIAAIKVWAQIFKDPVALAETIGKRWLFHGTAVKADIAKEQADWHAEHYFDAGDDTAAALVELLGPIESIHFTHGLDHGFYGYNSHHAGLDHNIYTHGFDYGYDHGTYAHGLDHGYDHGSYSHGLDHSYDHGSYAHGLDHGLDHGLEHGMEHGLDHGYDHATYTHGLDPHDFI